MTLTNSRAFQTAGDKKLKLLAIKSPDSQYYVPIDHPLVAAYEPMTEIDKNAASQEYLDAIGKNFWDKIPSIDKNQIQDTVQVRNDFPKLPASDWVALIKLYANLCNDTTKGHDLEVGGLIICHKETKQLRVVIPEQKVTKASVDWSITGSNLKDTKKIFFLDGTELPYSELKADWDFMGMTHSHNTMFTSPSGTDDKYEVGTKAKPLPTGVHILVGSFKNFKDYEYVEPDYDVYASVSHGGQRFRIENLADLVDLPSETEYIMNDFAEEILDIITTASITSYTQKKPATTPNVVQQKRQIKLDLIQQDVSAIQDLHPPRKKSVASTKFLNRAAYDLLSELVRFMYDDLCQEPEEIMEAISVDLLVEQEDGFKDFTGFEEISGFDDPFFVGKN